jgi:hypothetical protein
MRYLSVAGDGVGTVETLSSRGPWVSVSRAEVRGIESTHLDVFADLDCTHLDLIDACGIIGKVKLRTLG